MTKNMKSRQREIRKRRFIVGTVFLAICLVIAIIVTSVVMLVKNHFGNDSLICSGIQIGSVDVGGMTEAEAQNTVDTFIQKQVTKEIKIQIDQETVVVTCGEVGLSYDSADYASQALQIGKKGNLFQKMNQIREAESGKIQYDMKPQVDETVLTSFVDNLDQNYKVEVKDSTLKMKNGKLKATKSHNGRDIQEEATVQAIKEALAQIESKDSLEVSASVEITQPKYTKKQVSLCKDLLGTYTTTYATYQVERSANVANAVHYINGTVLYPGKTFSTIKVIKDRTEENGYKSAPEYSSGKVVEGIGGGVCQVSTTLYNAVINAELKVVERSPHSMVVGYVPVSRDAAISGTYKDFKFKNDTDAPVFIVGSASGGVLSFSIYGHDTREENRKISFESETVETIEPGAEVVTEDASLPASYRSVTQSAHVGYKAKLWKIVTVDGVQTDKVLINTSSYNPAPQYVTVGKQPATPAPEATDKSDKSNKADKTDGDKDSKKNTSTPVPKATPKSTPKASNNN